MPSDGRESCAASRTPSAGRTVTPSVPPHGAGYAVAFGGASTSSVSVRSSVQRASAAPYGAHVHCSPAASAAAPSVQSSGVPPRSVGASNVRVSVSPTSRASVTPHSSVRERLASPGPGSEPQSPASGGEHESTASERPRLSRRLAEAGTQQRSTPTPAGVAVPRTSSSGAAPAVPSTCSRSRSIATHSPVTLPSGTARRKPLSLTWHASRAGTAAVGRLPGCDGAHSAGARSVAFEKRSVIRSPAP